MAFALCVLLSALAPPAAAEDRAPQRIAVTGFDALGMDTERVARLEALFRMELERLAGAPVATRLDVARLPRRYRRCDGSARCLIAIGKRLEVDLVVSGNVAALGDSYVVNIKVVDVATGEELRRIASDPLRGEPDALIESIRVAAYRLLAPERLQGDVALLVDRRGAQVSLDGRVVGETPLAGPISALSLGPHLLEVKAEGYEPFSETVDVRFQKTTRVVVRLEDRAPAPVAEPLGDPMADAPAPAPRWYQSTWFYVTAGATAALLGGYVGYRLAQDPIVDCSAEPMSCR